MLCFKLCFYMHRWHAMLLLCFKAAGIDQSVELLEQIVNELKGHGVKHHSNEHRLMNVERTLEETIRQAHQCVSVFDDTRTGV